MKLSLLFLFCSAAALHAQTTTWKLDAPADMKAWKPFGTVEGHTLGPSDGSYAVSGIASRVPVIKAVGNELTVKIDDFRVTQPAPHDAENGNDLWLNIALSPKAEPSYDNDAAVCNLVLSYNSVTGGIYASLQFKEGNKPNTGTVQIAGDFLGEHLSDIEVVMHLKPDSIDVDFKKGGSVLKQLSAKKSPPLSEMLKGNLFALVYQQNIQVSQGTVSVAAITSASAAKH